MSWFPGLLTRNWKLKLASICLAVLLWTSLRVEAIDRQVLSSVPVRVQLNDPRWAVRTEPVPATVEIQFSGPAGDLLGLYLERPTVTVPVDAVSAADTSVLLRSEWVRLPNRPSVTVEQIRPSRIALGFEPFNQAVVPVALRTSGTLSSDLALTEPLSVDPEVVRISGPASQLEPVDSVTLLPLSLSDVLTTGSRVLPVDTTGLYGTVISPGRVRVDYTVDERIRRTLDDVPIVPPQGEVGVQVDPITTTVTLVGARPLVDGLSPRSVWVEIPAPELAGLEEGEERSVSIEVRGTPALVSSEAGVSAVTVRRLQPQIP